ncbi:MAG: hypothetical protein CMM48_13410 [Rhodospirillaceae bacterium]|nr:hypothetical protein [Rhodospirillaceae bacterium]
MNEHTDGDPAGLESSLTALAKKSRDAQNIPDDIDWSLSPKKPFWLPKNALAWGINELFHGETIAGKVCERLVGMIDHPCAREILRCQIADETRHAEHYRRYIELIGKSVSEASEFEEVYGRILKWNGRPEAIMLAIHVMLESENMRIQKAVENWLPCPLFASISQTVAQDEARHIAFGQIYLRTAVPEMNATERFRIFEWLASLWNGITGPVTNKMRPPGMYEKEGGKAGWLREAWRERCDQLEKIGLFDATERPNFLSQIEQGGKA